MTQIRDPGRDVTASESSEPAAGRMQRDCIHGSKFNPGSSRAGQVARATRTVTPSRAPLIRSAHAATTTLLPLPANWSELENGLGPRVTEPGPSPDWDSERAVTVTEAFGSAEAWPGGD